MPRTVSDEEYQYLLGTKNVADMVLPILNNPKTSNRAKALIKEQYPDFQIPEYDLQMQIQQRFAAEDQKRKQEKEAEELKARQQRWDEQRVDAQKKFGLTEEGMKKLEDLMWERNIGDYEAAAMLFVSKEPKSTNAQFDSTRWHHEKQPDYAQIAEDPEAWGRDQIMQAINRDQERIRNRR